jgi:general secretion pathway protein D
MPVPQVFGKENHPDAEYVTRVIPVKNLPAASLVPVLRALLPQNAHLAAKAPPETRAAPRGGRCNGAYCCVVI